MSADLKGKRVAILATDGVEGVELTSPREALEQAGAKVEILAPKDDSIQLWDHDKKSVTVAVDRQVSEPTPATTTDSSSPAEYRTPTTCAWTPMP